MANDRFTARMLVGNLITLLAFLCGAPANAQEIDQPNPDTQSLRIRELEQQIRQKDQLIEDLRSELNGSRQTNTTDSQVESVGLQADSLEELPSTIGLATLQSDFQTGDSREQPYSTTFNGSGGSLENLSLFLGLNGSKQPQEFGVNAHFGGQFAANIGIPLSEETGIGLQVGTALNYTDNAVQVLERVDGTSGRLQSFTTVGLFQRNDGLIWGAAYDFLFQEYYDEFHLGQWRGKIGTELDDRNEVGLRASIANHGDRGVYRAAPAINVTLDPITQGSVYWTRTWDNHAATTIWAGLADGHGEPNLALGDFPPTNERFLFGAEVHIPLNDHLALFGQGNFIMPADTGTVDSYLGLVFYPDGGSWTARTRRFSPVLPVANTTSFAVDFA